MTLIATAGRQDIVLAFDDADGSLHLARQAGTGELTDLGAVRIGGAGDADLALLAGAIDGDLLRVGIADAVVDVTAEIVNWDTDLVTGAAPNSATLYDLEQLLTTIDTDTGTMAADTPLIADRLLMAAAPPTGEAPEADASVAELLHAGLFGDGGSGAAQLLQDTDFALESGGNLDDIAAGVASSSIGDDTIADILENAFGLFTPFYGDPGGGTVGLAPMLADAFSGAGTLILPPPFHDSNNYHSFPDILYDAFGGGGAIFGASLPFHDGSGNPLASILSDVFTGGAAIVDPNVFVDNTTLTSVADLLYSIKGALYDPVMGIVSAADYLEDIYLSLEQTRLDVEDNRMPVVDTITDDDWTDPSTDDTFDVANPSRFRAGDVIRPDGSDELLRVESVDTGASTITVTRGYNSTTPEALAENQDIRVVDPELVAMRADIGTIQTDIAAIKAVTSTLQFNGQNRLRVITSGEDE